MSGAMSHGLRPLQPRRIPKWRLMTIAKSDRSARIEELGVIARARIAHPNPKLGGVRPFMPKPPETQSRPKLLGVADPQSSKIGWAAHLFPIDLALASGNLIGGRPKKRALDIGDLGDEPGRQLE